MNALIPLKAWIAEEAIRQGVTDHAVWTRRRAGWYPALSTIAVNKRRIYVDFDGTPTRLRLMDWVTREAKRVNLTNSAIYMRLARGKYPELSLTRINRSVVFVEAQEGK